MIVEIPVGKSRYKITCQEGEQEKIMQLAEKLNHRVNQMAFSIKNADEKTLLVIAALTLQEELSRTNHDEDDVDDGKLNEQDVYDAVSENMENVADYIEKLIVKIQNY